MVGARHHQMKSSFQHHAESPNAPRRWCTIPIFLLKDNYPINQTVRFSFMQNLLNTLWILKGLQPIGIMAAIGFPERSKMTSSLLTVFKEGRRSASRSIISSRSLLSRSIALRSIPRMIAWWITPSASNLASLGMMRFMGIAAHV